MATLKVSVRALPGVEEAAIRAVLPAMRRLGADIETAMMTHEYANRTGLLESSTSSDVDDATGTLTVTNDASRTGADGEVFYGPFVEFGTSRMRPRPFMLPALVSQMGERR
jgi:HK97 gp10 family phage protein